MFWVNTWVPRRDTCVFTEKAMQKTTEGKRNGIQWTPFQQLDDLDFADDIALLSHRQDQGQDKVKLMQERSAEVGLRINIKKTKVLRANTVNQTPIELQGQNLEEVEVFPYLGSIMDREGGTERDVAVRIGKARVAFRMLANIWKEGRISLHTKLRLFNSNVKSVLLYGAETWKLTKGTTQRIQVFINTSLRRICNIRWPNKITNEDLWKKTKESPIEVEIKRRKWKWIGHTLRKATNSINRQSLQWNPQGKRK